MSIPSLREQIKLRGHQEEPIIVIPTKELLAIKSILDQTDMSKLTSRRTNLKYVLDESRAFYERNFRLIDVPFLKENKIGPIRIDRYGTIHPFGLPIKKENIEDSFFGSLNEVLLKGEKEHDIFYKSVSLPKRTSDITKLSYSHELAHSQLNHVKGLIKSYNNSEVISIFIELLMSLQSNQDESLLRQHDYRRLTELKEIITELEQYKNQAVEVDSIDDDNLIEASAYATSTLKAYQLFFKYYYGDTSIKKEILSSIQNVFYQNRSIEDTLQDYDITFASSQNSTQLLSYLKR